MWDCALIHSTPSAPTVDLAAAASTNSPLAFDTSTDAKKSCASRLVLNPRFVPWEWSGFLNVARYRVPDDES